MKILNKNKKVLMCLSGGVDSSVSLALLKKAGYDVTAAFMVNYDEQRNGEECWRNDYRDALLVAAHLGVKLLRLNFVKEYSDAVLSYMYQEYEAARTPNPDVLCNKFVKFGAWLKKAEELGFDYIATGHYAAVKNRFGKYYLSEAKDKNKDQTYFLHQLNQEQLKRTLFPLGKYTKDEVRKIAKKLALPTAQKSESMGICFIGEVSMRDFLKNKINSKPGDIVNESGEVIGKHDGLAYYTIGQRNLGLNSNNGKPLFVLQKDIKGNRLVVGNEDSPLLYQKKTVVKKPNWISGVEPRSPFTCLVRLRHRAPLVKATLKKEDDAFLVEFEKPERAITPGQFAVFYKGGNCLGGGELF